MSEQKNVYQRLAIAKLEIVKMDLNKDGQNAHITRKTSDKNGRTVSKAYGYFTLEYLVPIVTSVCTANGLLTNFLLLEDSFGLYGLLTVTNIDNPQEKIEIIHRTGISAENKMMNKTQQYGSVSTYSHRYLLQHTFGIVDNDLDPDNEKFYENIQSQSQSTSKAESNSNNSTSYISEAQRKRLFAITNECNVPSEKVKEILKSFNTNSSSEIRKSDYDAIVAKVQELKQ